jgi:hypothetical protein
MKCTETKIEPLPCTSCKRETLHLVSYFFAREMALKVEVCMPCCTTSAEWVEDTNDDDINWAKLLK